MEWGFNSPLAHHPKGFIQRHIRWIFYFPCSNDYRAGIKPCSVRTVVHSFIAVPRPRALPHRVKLQEVAHYSVRNRVRITAPHGALLMGNTMTTGTVKWFNDDKGYGFISPDTGEADVFAHFSNIVQASGRRTLVEGEKVEFDIAQGPKGLQAENIQRLG